MIQQKYKKCYQGYQVPVRRRINGGAFRRKLRRPRVRLIGEYFRAAVRLQWMPELCGCLAMVEADEEVSSAKENLDQRAVRLRTCGVHKALQWAGFRFTVETRALSARIHAQAD